MFWDAQLAGWIKDLVASGQKGWTANDLLKFEQDDTTQQMGVLRSSHARENGLLDIELRHLWVQMN